MKNIYLIIFPFLLVFIIGCSEDPAENNTSSDTGINTTEAAPAEHKARITYEDLTFMPDLKRDVRGGTLTGKDEDYYTLNMQGEKNFSFFLDAAPNTVGIRIMDDEGKMIRSEINKDGRIVQVFEKTQTGIYRIIVHLERNTRMKLTPVKYDITFNRE